MINREQFFATVREEFGPLKQSQVDGFNAILDGAPLDMLHGQLAYVLATAWHEVDKRMQPIEEYGKGAVRPYGKRLKMNGQAYKDVDGIFYGRGFVQLTWYENYDKAGKKLHKDFLHNPAGVMQIDNAVQIMFLGMLEGWFTGKKLSNYITADKADFVQARKIINGLDKADLIAGYASKFLRCLVSGV